MLEDLSPDAPEGFAAVVWKLDLEPQEVKLHHLLARLSHLLNQIYRNSQQQHN